MIEVIAEKRAVWDRRISFYARTVLGPNVSLAMPVVFQNIERGSVALEVEPVFSLEVDEAQKLMDSLWDCGLRPSEGSGSAGALAATQRHLEDMRKLVFEK